MIEAIISIKLPGVWVTELVKRFSLEVRILDTIPFGKEGVQDLIEIRIEEDGLEEVVNFLKELKDVENVDIEQVEEHKAIGIIKMKMCFGCRVLLAADCHLISSLVKEDASVEWTIIASNRDQLKKLIEGLEKYKAEPKLIKLSSLKDDEMLTNRQELIVKTAFKRGYYDFPKRIGVKELADMFEVSTATLSEILRRGQKKIIEKYFNDN